MMEESSTRLKAAQRQFLSCSLERKSSIETEPLTLTLEQLRYAREAAIYVAETKTLEEALRIFTEGLQPVLSVNKRTRRRVLVPVNFDDLSDDWDYQIPAAVARGSIPRLSSSVKDVATAPF